jgi:hypothetical protein
MTIITYTLIVQICYGWGYSYCRDQVQARGLSYSQCMSERNYWSAGGRRAYCRTEGY